MAVSQPTTLLCTTLGAKFTHVPFSYSFEEQIFTHQISCVNTIEMASAMHVHSLEHLCSHLEDEACTSSQEILFLLRPTPRYTSHTQPSTKTPGRNADTQLSTNPPGRKRYLRAFTDRSRCPDEPGAPHAATLLQSTARSASPLPYCQDDRLLTSRCCRRVNGRRHQAWPAKDVPTSNLGYPRPKRCKHTKL